MINATISPVTIARKGVPATMRDTFRSLISIVCLLLAVAAAAEVGWQTPASNVVEKKLDFPSPVQWKRIGTEISLIGVALGPADSPEMIAKRNDKVAGQKPQTYPDRTYALALRFLAKLPGVGSVGLIESSGLVRVKNVDGDTESPMQLTASGFVVSGSDVHFNQSSTAKYWDFFPVSPNEKEFLFEAPLGPRGTPKLSFKIILKDNDFLVANVTPGAGTCLNFSKNFAGSVGAGTGITFTLTREGTKVSGTEQYVGIGKTLWLGGSADSLGNLVVEENYPKDVVTGIFKGALSEDCRTISGFFSKPDGSRLQPFEVHEAEEAKP